MRAIACPSNRGEAMATSATGKWIYWLEEVTKDHNDLVGKKCAYLGEMTRAGFNVPRGFALSLEAYDRFMNSSGALTEINNHLSLFRADAHDPAHLGKWGEVSEMVRRIAEMKLMPRDMQKTITVYYEELCRRTGIVNCPVATRSAGPSSHPGQYETFLHIKGISEVLQHIIKVWASTFNQRSLVARARGGYRLDYDPIGVAVLQMVNAKAAGVMFTLNPANGDRSKIMIDGNWGLGESVVSGSVTPDEWVVDKVVLEIITHIISPKGLEYIVDPSGKVIASDIPPERQNVPCLTDKEVIELARRGKQIEQYYGIPQDIEWVIDKDLPFPENIFFVQTRPETIWSKKEAESKLKTSGSVTADVVSFWRNVKA
jgi:pyruvate,water dikinase